MVYSQTTLANAQGAESSNFIGQLGYYLSIKEGSEIGINDFDLITVEHGAYAGVSEFGKYCTTWDGQQVTWYPTVNDALQLAYAFQDDWMDYGYKKPFRILLSDEMKQILDYENSMVSKNFEKACRYEDEMHSKLNEGFYCKIEQYGAKVERVKDKERQLQGIDAIITKPTGEQIFIDEKAREKKDKNTFGLEIWNNYGGKGNFTDGWFMDEKKLTRWYCFLHTENGVNYATFVNVKALKDKLFSILTKEELLDYNMYANKAVKAKIQGAFVYDSNQWEHGRFLILPLEFYKKVPGTFEVTI